MWCIEIALMLNVPDEWIWYQNQVVMNLHVCVHFMAQKREPLSCCAEIDCEPSHIHTMDHCETFEDGVISPVVWGYRIFEPPGPWDPRESVTKHRKTPTFDSSFMTHGMLCIRFAQCNSRYRSAILRRSEVWVISVNRSVRVFVHGSFTPILF